MPIPPTILERIETFRRNLDSYLSPEYKEAQVRQEFIDPLFAALGWDVRNTHGYAEAYKDVVHEDTLRISGSGTTAPDYSFRIGGTRKFFVEAKRPSVQLKVDPEPADQLRRYSWSAKLSLGIVTDFQEFAVYDTRIRPNPTMPKRAFTKKPKEKSEDYHGACQINELPKSFRPGSTATVPLSLNLDMNFEEALKFGIAVQSCLQSLNRYNRATKSGRDMGLGLCIKFDVKQITVMESRTG